MHGCTGKSFKLCFNSPVNDIQIESKCDLVITPRRISRMYAEKSRKWKRIYNNIQFILEMAFAKDQFKASWYFPFAWKWEKSNNFCTIESQAFRRANARTRTHNRVELLNEKRIKVTGKRNAEKNQKHQRTKWEWWIPKCRCCAAKRIAHNSSNSSSSSCVLCISFSVEHSDFILVFSRHFQHVIHHNFLFSRLTSRIFIPQHAHAFAYQRTRRAHTHTQSVHYAPLKHSLLYEKTSNSRAYRVISQKKRNEEGKKNTRNPTLNLYSWGYCVC